jgi:rod shape-determining protein MreD
LSVLWTGLSLLAALVVQAAASLLVPQHSRALDPFLIAVVYWALAQGEVHGMLTGVAAGWIQDVHFGGPVAGLSGLTKLLLGFGVGMTATRFVIAGTPARALVLFLACLVEALGFERLAQVFAVPVIAVSLPGLLGRAALNAALGALVFALLEWRLREARA